LVRTRMFYGSLSFSSFSFDCGSCEVVDLLVTKN
jgi:hypothetical protein